MIQKAIAVEHRIHSLPRDNIKNESEDIAQTIDRLPLHYQPYLFKKLALKLTEFTYD